jgi:hypothetical protein
VSWIYEHFEIGYSVYWYYDSSDDDKTAKDEDDDYFIIRRHGVCSTRPGGQCRAFLVDH